MTISDRIKKLMSSYRITQEMIAETSGVTKGAISAQLKKEVDSIKTVVAVSKLSGANLEWLILGTGEMFKSEVDVQEERLRAMMREEIAKSWEERKEK